jgi:hypothetical protein
MVATTWEPMQTSHNLSRQRSVNYNTAGRRFDNSML